MKNVVSNKSICLECQSLNVKTAYNLVYEIAIKCFYTGVVIVFVLFYLFLCLPKLNRCALWFFFLLLLSSECTNGHCLQGCRFFFKSIHMKKIVMCIGSVSQNGFFTLHFQHISIEKNGRVSFFYYFLFDVNKSILWEILLVKGWILFCVARDALSFEILKYSSVYRV